MLISKYFGVNPVNGLNANTLNPLSFKLIKLTTSGLPHSGSQITTLQSNGIVIEYFPI